MFHLDKKVPKSAVLYFCECCDYNTSHKSHYNKHLATDKHKRNCFKFVSKTAQKVPKQQFTCETCKKNYKSRTTLWRHKKTCNLGKVENVEELKPHTVINNINVIIVNYTI